MCGYTNVRDRGSPRYTPLSMSRVTWPTQTCAVTFLHVRLPLSSLLASNGSCRIWMSPIHTNETYHIWMCHVTCKCVQSHTRVRIVVTSLSSLSSLSSLHFLCCLHQHRMSRVKYECIMSRIHKSRHTWMRHVKYKWFTYLCPCGLDQYRASHVWGGFG